MFVPVSTSSAVPDVAQAQAAVPDTGVPAPVAGPVADGPASGAPAALTSTASASAACAVAQGERPIIDPGATITEYLDRSDWRVNANANQGYSLGGMMLNTSGKVVANYWLSHVYPAVAGQAHRNGDLHIHDLDMFAGYCAGWSLKNLLQQGFKLRDRKSVV